MGLHRQYQKSQLWEKSYSWKTLLLLHLFGADAKSTPTYSSDLHFSVFQYRPDRGALMCSKICLKKLWNKSKGRIFWTDLRPLSAEVIFQTYFTPPMWKISDFGRSAWQLHYNTDKFRSKEIRGGASAITTLPPLKNSGACNMVIKP